MNMNCDCSQDSVDGDGADRKPRIDEGQGFSPLQRLKMLPENAHDLLLEQRSEMSLRLLIGEIESRHGIAGLVPRLTEFFAWLSERRAVRRMKENAAVFRENFVASNPDATLEQAHEAVLSSLLLRAVGEDNGTLLRLVLSEIRLARTLVQSRKRLEIAERQVALQERRAWANQPAPVTKGHSPESQVPEGRQGEMREAKSRNTILPGPPVIAAFLDERSQLLTRSLPLVCFGLSRASHPPGCFQQATSDAPASRCSPLTGLPSEVRPERSQRSCVRLIRPPSVFSFSQAGRSFDKFRTCPPLSRGWQNRLGGVTCGKDSKCPEIYQRFSIFPSAGLVRRKYAVR